MEEKYAGRNTEEADLIKVLLAVKASTMRDLHVASLGIIKDISNDEYSIKTFPTIKGSSDKNIVCLNCYSGTLSIGDIVLVLFTDRNTIQTLRQAKSRQKLTELTNDEELHSEKFGVIIARINFNEEE